MIPSEAPTDNVWNAGVVTDCWRFLSLVSICQLLLQSTQHEPTFYNQFSLVCNRKKNIYNNIVHSHCDFFFPTILKTSWSVLRLTLDVIRQREKISVIRYFWCPFVLPYLQCHTFCGGLLAPLCRPKTPDLSDQDTKITWPYLQVVSLTNLNR